MTIISKGDTVLVYKGGLEGIVKSLDDKMVELQTQHGTRLLRLEQVISIQDYMLSRITNRTFDNSKDFVLSMESYWLLTEYKFNPHVLAASSKIRLFPHQIDEVIWGLDNSKIMIADEVGLGKTIIAALIVSELKARGLANRSLFVVPKSLVLKWKKELKTRFEYDADILDSKYIKNYPDSFQRERYAYISSMDYLRQEHVYNAIRDVDVVVVDEAHKLKLGTDRLVLGKRLSEETHTLILLTATPHDGRDKDFLARIRLLDPWAEDVSASAYLWTRSIKEDVRDMEGRTIFPPRHSETVSIRLTNAERDVACKLEEYFKWLDTESISLQERKAVMFITYIFKKRASSSIVALRSSLERRHNRLGQGTTDDVEKTKNAIDSWEEGIDEEISSETEGYTPTRDYDEERKLLYDIITKIDQMNKRDSKLEQLLESIQKVKSSDPKAKVVLFTEYRDTLEYLRKMLRYKTGKIDGTMTMHERENALERFKDEDGSEIMLCTDAAGEGIDMQFCNIEFNYDLPWNPNKLEQRMGRIHRINQNRPVFYYNFVVDDKVNIDGYIMRKLVDKIENIKKAIGEKVYNIIGSIIDHNSIEQYYERLRRVPHAKWEPIITQFVDEIEYNKNRILEQSKQMLEGYRFDTSTIEDISRKMSEIPEKDIHKLVQALVETQGGMITNIGENQYKIVLSPNVIEGTFDHNIAEKYDIPYLSFGNVIINRMISEMATRRVAVLTHANRKGVLCVYRMTVSTSKGVERYGKVIALFYNNDDGTVDDIDISDLWEYGEAVQNHKDTNVKLSIHRITEKIEKISSEYLQDKQKELKKIKNKSIRAAESHAASRILKADKKIQEYKDRRREGSHIEGMIKKECNMQKKTTIELEKIKNDINYRFTARVRLEMLGLSIVTSKDMGPTHIPNNPGNNEDVKKAVECAGMDAVMKRERERASNDSEREKVVDVSEKTYLGYDIESFDRCIEVKSFTTTGEAIMTDNEWETCKKKGDVYWLYTVENALSKPDIKRYKNPCINQHVNVKIETKTTKRYILDNL